ncbi:phage minor head protein [Brevibacillus choshinensis]|uniref:phage minor head protein n=1 Tax=Brevibacillus choshinensis TaxID=54911 RepID=UPI002E223E93|nr:phage minor head protein [Brevibacillus choshinensis]
MCDQCLYLIAKADDDDFLDSLDLTHAERKLLEMLYKDGEESIADLLELQGKELDEAIQELSDELASDADELWKVILQIQEGDYFQDKFEQAVYDAFMPLFNLAGESEAIAINTDAKWEQENKAAAKFAKKLKKLVPAMNDTSADHMIRSFKRAIEVGKTPSERAVLVKEVSKQAAAGEEGPFTMTRSVTISRTISTAAANGGKLEGWKQSGLVKKKRWRAANNKRTRKDHKDANGQEVDIDKPFKVGGEKLMHPGDPAGSAKQIVQCRCSMQAVF